VVTFFLISIYLNIRHFKHLFDLFILFIHITYSYTYYIRYLQSNPVITSVYSTPRLWCRIFFFDNSSSAVHKYSNIITEVANVKQTSNCHDRPCLPVLGGCDSRTVRLSVGSTHRPVSDLFEPCATKRPEGLSQWHRRESNQQPSVL
jgi:hypothetical protein